MSNESRVESIGLKFQFTEGDHVLLNEVTMMGDRNEHMPLNDQHRNHIYEELFQWGNESIKKLIGDVSKSTQGFVNISLERSSEGEWSAQFGVVDILDTDLMERTEYLNKMDNDSSQVVTEVNALILLGNSESNKFQVVYSEFFGDDGGLVVEVLAEKGERQLGNDFESMVREIGDFVTKQIERENQDKATKEWGVSGVFTFTHDDRGIFYHHVSRTHREHAVELTSEQSAILPEMIEDLFERTLICDVRGDTFASIKTMQPELS